MIFERLQESFRFWWQHLAAIALVALPYSLLGSGASLLFGPPLVLEGDTPTSINGITLAAILVVRTLAEGALIVQLAAILAGRPRSLGECALLSLTLAPALLLCNLAILTATSLGLLLFILPGVWIFVRLALAPFLIVLEQQSPLVALQQSLERTRHIQWELMAAWLGLMLTVLMASNIVGVLLINLIGSHAGTSVLLDLFTALAGALLQVLLFRYYGLSKPSAPPEL